jgi:hypothetical protein
VIDGARVVRKVAGMELRTLARQGAFIGLLGATACSRSDAPPRTETIATVAETTASVSSPAVDWATELGQVLIVPADSDGTGVVLFPDAPTVRLMSSAALTLVGPGGDTAVTRATLAVADSQVCGEAPTVRFNDSVSTSWSVGLLGKHALTLKMDSLGGLPARDSIRLTAELARLASSIPMDAGSRFKGLPFAVVAAQQFEVNGRPSIVTHLVRRLPQEAAPLEEHTFFVAEADSGTTSPRRWTLAYHQRSEGSEETAEQYELLAVMRGRTNTLLLIARHRDTQSTYEVLERAATGWRSRWHRVLSC